jgi:hypothetical protein
LDNLACDRAERTVSAPSRAAEEGRGGRPGRSVPAAALLGRDVEKGPSTPLAPTAARGGSGPE